MKIDRRKFVKGIAAGFITASTSAVAVEKILDQIDKELTQKYPDGLIEYTIKTADTWERVVVPFTFKGKEYTFTSWVKASNEGQKVKIKFKEDNVEFDKSDVQGYIDYTKMTITQKTT